MKLQLLLFAFLGLVFLAVVGVLVYNLLHERFKGQNELLTEIHKKDKAIDALNVQLGALPEKNAKLESENATQARKLEALRLEKETNETNLTNKYADIVKFKETEIANLTATSKTLEEQKAKLTALVAKMQKDMKSDVDAAEDTLKKKYETQLNEIPVLQTELASKTVKLKDAAEKYSKLEDSVAEKDKSIFALNNQIITLNNQMKGFKRDVELAEDKSSTLLQKVAELKTTINLQSATLNQWNDWLKDISRLSADYGTNVDRFVRITLPNNVSTPDEGIRNIHDDIAPYKTAFREFRTELKGKIDNPPK